MRLSCGEIIPEKSLDITYIRTANDLGLGSLEFCHCSLLDCEDDETSKEDNDGAEEATHSGD